MKSSLANKLFVRYAIISLGIFVLAMSGIFLLHAASSLTAWTATVFGVLLFALNYIVQKKWVFNNKEAKLAPIVCQILLVFGVAMLDLEIGAIAASAVPDKLLKYLILVVLAVTFAINYILYKRIFAASYKGIRNFTVASLFSSSNLKRIGIGLLLCLPIVIFSLGLLKSGQKIIPGDPDYYLQIYEAFRRSILEFHQLPFWNGWVGGGIPLFANIQFGFISIQAPFILIFGTVVGMKIAIVAYQIVAFFGFKKLFEKVFKTTKLRAILLAYIPIFGSFFVDRVVAGHYTFLLISFVPWLILFYIQRRQKFNWLYFAFIYSIMVWSSPHYVTIMAMLVIGIWFLYEKIGHLAVSIAQKSYTQFIEHTKKDLAFFAKAGGAILILCFYRLFFVADFIKDFPRNNPVTNESFTGIKTGLYAIWGPDQYASPPELPSGWGWAEAATYIGIGTAVCLIIVLCVQLYTFYRKRKREFNYSLALLALLFLTFFVLGMGNFGQFAPYSLLSHAPIFDSMRVATRWLMWASLFVLFIIAAYKGKYLNKTINIILLFTVIELFLSGSKVLGGAYFLETQQYRSAQANFSQEYKYNIPRVLYANDKNYLTNYSYDENLYETTRNNLGQVIAGDSLVDTRQPNTTVRCGENQFGCMYISNNARVAYWSPNKVILERTMPGPININMNPGKGWLVNNKYVFSGDKITAPLKSFIIDDSSNVITLEYAPKLSPLWFKKALTSDTSP